ncbi:hypothetical protein K492DRAFT_180279 [Lichtheimia hyalospora FSU 10163]|nr:hypothetical protein K492DRAFT_180279 [Lichtheimia hyalospora FSU 10163]
MTIAFRTSTLRYPNLAGTFHYSCIRREKDIAIKLIAAFDAWLRIPPADLAAIKNAVQKLQSKSSTIKYTDYVYFLVYKNLAVELLWRGEQECPIEEEYGEQ